MNCTDLLELHELGQAIGSVVADVDVWWLREFGELAAIADPVERARAATFAIQQAEAMMTHCSALRDVAVREAAKTWTGPQSGLASAIGVSTGLMSTLVNKKDVNGSAQIVRAALRRLTRLGG